MKHSEFYKIRWHDTDANRVIRPSQLVSYMQETANAQLLANGTSLDDLRDKQGLAFLLSRITVHVYADLYTDDEICVQTWICEGKGFRFDRCFRVLRGEEVVAEAYSMWALLDLKNRRMLRATEFSYGFEGDDPLPPEFYARVRIPALADMEKAGERRIVYSDIDYNGHMNNTHYPDMLCDFTPNILGLRVRALTLSFLHEGTFGHTLAVYRAEQEDGRLCFRTVDGDGVTCLEAVLTLEPRCKESREGTNGNEN